MAHPSSSAPTQKQIQLLNAPVSKQGSGACPTLSLKWWGAWTLGADHRSFDRYCFFLVSIMIREGHFKPLILCSDLFSPNEIWASSPDMTHFPKRTFSTVQWPPLPPIPSTTLQHPSPRTPSNTLQDPPRPSKSVQPVQCV